MFFNGLLHRGFQYLLFITALLIFAVSPSPKARAQLLTGSLQGNITDPSGQVLVSAVVKATNEGTGEIRQTTANSSGEYTISDLTPGTYSLTVTCPNFQTRIQQGIILGANNLLRLDIKMEIGHATQSVTVSSAPPALQTESAEVTDYISTDTLATIPVPVGRNYQNLLRAVPGVSVSGGGAIRGSNPAGSLTMYVNGGSSTTNATTIDGAITADQYNPGNVAYIPTLDSIASVNVETNSFSAEFSAAGASAVSIQIKSGTNSLHGSAFDFFTNQALQAFPAVNPLHAAKPAYSYNQYGGILGGPILKNKLFYFGSFSATNWRQIYTAYDTVPTDAAKAGNLSESSTPIYDPVTGATNGTGRTAFPGNMIPQSRLSLITKELLPLWPEPNVPGATLANNYFGSGQSPYDNYAGDGKVNWNVNDKLLVFVRAGISRYDEFNAAILGPAIGGYTLDNQQSGNAFGGVDSFTGAATYILTPRLSVDGYFGFTRNIQNAEQPDLNEDIGSSILGIPGTNGTRSFEGGWPIILIDDGYNSIGGDSRNDRGMPWFRDNFSYEYTGHINWTHGRHNVRGGLDVSLSNLNFIQPNVVGNLFGASGGFEFSVGPTQLNGGGASSQDNAFASFLLGLPSQEGRTYSVPNSYSYYAQTDGAYIQDGWNVTQKLTATLGLRWDFYPIGNRGYRGLETYNFSTNKMNICGVANVLPKNCGIDMSKKLFSPRVGFAWRPTDDLVARAGFALSYDPYDFAPQWGFQNFPVQIYSDIAGLTSYQPDAPWEDGIPAAVVPDTSSGEVPVPSSVAVYTPKTPDFNRGYIESWNMTIEQTLPSGFVSQIGYVANHQIRIEGEYDLNAGQVIGAGVAGQPYYQKFGRTASTYQAGPIWTGTYSALQTSLEHRLSKGIQLSMNYVWSKAIGTNSGGGTVLDTQYWKLNRARLNFNRAQVFNLYGALQLPFGKDKRWLNENGLGSKILGGWTVNPLFTIQTGQPFSVSASATSLNLPGSSQMANQVKPHVAIYGASRTGPYFDTSAFAAVTTPNFGNAGFNSLIGPGIIDLDLGLFREFPIRENVKLQFRVEAYNATNTPHWSNPASNVSSGGFALITSTNASNLGRSGTDQRTIRLGAHVSF